MTKLVEYAPDLGIATITIGLLGYAIALALAAFFSAKEGSLGARLRTWFTNHPAQNLGIPCAAISAFAIVAALRLLGDKRRTGIQGVWPRIH